jgi:hypothetical protein
MKLFYIILASLTIIQLTASEEKSNASKALQLSKTPIVEKKDTTVFDTLIVTARLTEIPGRFAANDAYDYVYVMKYRILKVEKGTYIQKELLVGHYNPLIPRKLIKDKMDSWCNGTVEKFTIGDKQRLVLLRPLDKIWDGAMEDEFRDSELEQYFAVKADILK